MGFGAKLARGLLAGGADYFQHQADSQIEERKAQALLDRQMALAKFQSGLRKDEAAHQGTVQAALDKVETDNNVDEVVRTLPAKTSSTIAVNSADAKDKERLEGVQQKNRLALENVKHDHTLSEDQNKAALSLSNDLAKAGKTVAHWEVATDGRMTAFSATGEVLGQSNAGRFVPKSDGSDDFSFDSGAAAPPPRVRPERGGATAKPADSAQPSDAKLYTDADVAETMRTNKLSRTEAIKRIEALGYKRQ